MPDETSPKDARAVWRDQPEEELPVTMNESMTRRAEQMFFTTRSEVAMSVGAALFFALMMAWRISPAPTGAQGLAIGAVVLWSLVTLYWFRSRIWSRPRPDDAAATGMDFYRRQLETRRDHLRSVWLWHGPLALACILFVMTVTGRYSFVAVNRLGTVAPLVAVLLGWTAFGIWRRLRQASEIQREIDEIDRMRERP
jgi:hypothetical protein